MTRCGWDWFRLSTGISFRRSFKILAGEPPKCETSWSTIANSSAAFTRFCNIEFIDVFTGGVQWYHLKKDNTMKRNLLAAFLTAGFQLQAAISSADAKLADEFSITSREASQRVWERTDYEIRPDGSRVARVHRVVELATGMYYTNAAGQWLESREEIEIVPGGAVARQGNQKVIFNGNLNTVSAIDLEAPDGKRLRSSVLGLCYFDSGSGKSVVIAEVQDSHGEIFANQVLYADAFEGLKADVRYTYTRSGFEQDTILREQPPGPEAFGLNSATTTLQVLTEFYNPPQATTRAVRVPEGDVFLDFGSVKIGRGKAFLIGEERNEVLVRNQWLKIEGRDVLIEEVPLSNLRTQLETLPRTAMLPASNSVIRTASKERLLPPKRVAKVNNPEMKLAKSSAPAQGLVLDYSMLAGYWPGDFTLEGGVTYYVTGPYSVGGTLTIEGGTCESGGKQHRRNHRAEWRQVRNQPVPARDHHDEIGQLRW
jgi:hypothetical protein